MCGEMERSKSTFYIYLSLAWLAGIGALSYFLWGEAVQPGAWMGNWASAFFDALFSLPAVFQSDPGVLWGAVVIVGCALCGRSVPARIMREDPPWSICFAAGMVILTVLFTVFGNIGLYKPVSLVVITLAAAIWGLIDILWVLPPKTFSSNKYQLRPVEFVILAVPGIVVLVSLMNPTWFYDTLNYHLALPRQYLISGFTEPVSWHPYSFFPSCAELMLGAGLIGGVLSAQVVSGGVWLFTMLALRDTAVRHFPERSGPAVLGVSLAAVTITNSAVLPGIDHFVLLFTTGGLFFLCGFFEKSDDDKQGLTGWMIGWGLMAGGAATVKYTSWLQVLLVQVIFISVLAFKHRSFRDILPGPAIAFLILLPWPLRNLAAAGNPVMPVPIDGLWKGLSDSAWQAFKQDAHAINLSFHSLPEVILAPWNMVFNEWDKLNQQWGSAHFIGPLLWMGVPLFLLAGKNKNRQQWLVFVYGIVALYLSVFSFRMVRFAYPAIGALVIIAGAGIHSLWLRSEGRRVIRVPAAIILGAVFLLCAAVMVKTTANISGGYSYPRLGCDKQKYIERLLQVRKAPPNSLPLQIRANHVLPADATILLAGETRFFYLRREAVAPYFLVPHPFFELLKHTSFSEAAIRLKSYGISHLLICIPEMERLRPQYEKIGYPPPSPQKVARFINSEYCKPVLEDRPRGSVLCRIEPGNKASSSKQGGD